MRSSDADWLSGQKDWRIGRELGAPRLAAAPGQRLTPRRSDTVTAGASPVSGIRLCHREISAGDWSGGPCQYVGLTLFGTVLDIDRRNG